MDCARSANRNKGRFVHFAGQQPLYLLLSTVPISMVPMSPGVARLCDPERAARPSGVRCPENLVPGDGMAHSVFLRRSVVDDPSRRRLANCGSTETVEAAASDHRNRASPRN